MIRIGERKVGPGYPVFICCEVSGNHNGDLNRAIALIEAAKRAGADAVKFQAFTMEEILTLRGRGQAPPPWESVTLPELYAKSITPAEWFPELFTFARDLGLIPFASVFGRRSLALLESLDCPVYKIAKAEARVGWLEKAVRATGKDVLISGANVLCPGGYPCKPEELGLERIYRGGFVGLSCHCPDPLVGPVAAGAGASYLEFHLTLDDGVPTLDDDVNLTASLFAEMVRLVWKAEMMR